MSIGQHPSSLLMAFGSERPRIADSAWIASNASVVGAVTLEDDASIWYGASIRAEAAPIRVGRGSNVQDNCVIHTDPGSPVTIGDSVTIGHGAILHGCQIHNGVLVGMGAVVMNDVVIGAGSLIAAGAVVIEGTTVPAGCLVAGVPGKIRRVLDQDTIDANQAYAHHYVDLARRHRSTFEERR